jgi:hypothetical protein
MSDSPVTVKALIYTSRQFRDVTIAILFLYWAHAILGSDFLRIFAGIVIALGSLWCLTTLISGYKFFESRNFAASRFRGVPLLTTECVIPGKETRTQSNGDLWVMGFYFTLIVASIVFITGLSEWGSTLLAGVAICLYVFGLTRYGDIEVAIVESPFGYIMAPFIDRKVNHAVLIVLLSLLHSAVALIVLSPAAWSL